MAQMFCEMCYKPNPSAFTDCGHLACATCYGSRSPASCPVCNNQKANVIAVAKVDQMTPHLSNLFKPLPPQLEAAKKALAEATALLAEVCEVAEVNALSWALSVRSDCAALPNYCAREQFQNNHYNKVAQGVQECLQAHCDKTQQLEQKMIEQMKELRCTISPENSGDTDMRF